MLIALMGQRSVQVNADQYLRSLLQRETVNTGPASPVRGVIVTLRPVLLGWGGKYLTGITPSGSFAKDTAIRSGTDIDLFLSLAANTPGNLHDNYLSLYNTIAAAGYNPKKQNVSVNIRVGGYDVDLVPGRRQDNVSNDHSLYRSKTGSWTKTNVHKHIGTVRGGGRLLETRILKLWRNQKGLNFPSFYLELTVIDALRGRYSQLSENVLKVLQYLNSSFVNARVIDPANTGNIISDDLTAAEKNTIKNAAARALGGTWADFVS